MFVVTLCLTGSLSGCGMFGDDGIFRNRSGDYLEAESIPPIVVPEELDSDTLGQLYVVPPISETATLAEDTAVPRPQPLSENLLEEKVKIQSYANQRWILINRTPSEVWPRVRNVLNRSGIPAVRADAGQGILETGWLEFKQEDGKNHRYRFSIEPGVQMDSTEIKVLHNQKPKASENTEQVAWPAVSDSDQQEKSMVEILANALAGDLSSGSVSLLAQSIGGSSKVDILTPKVADPYMLIKLDYDRAWASVSYSVSKGGFTTVDQDRSGGIFYVNYQAEEEEEGFFSRWFGGDDEEEKTLRVNYQVNLRTASEGVEVRITGPEGESLNRNEALRLLKAVRANLS